MAKDANIGDPRSKTPNIKTFRISKIFGLRNRSGLTENFGRQTNALWVMDIVGNEHGDPSSNPEEAVCI